jgi:hypothetical protein
MNTSLPLTSSKICKSISPSGKHPNERRPKSTFSKDATLKEKDRYEEPEKILKLEKDI